MTPERHNEIMVRDRFRCVRCGDLDGPYYSVHHRKLKGQGGTDDPWNLIVLCGSGTTGCHHLVHSRRAEIGEPGGYIVSSHADPATIPVLYHRRGEVLL